MKLVNILLEFKNDFGSQFIEVPVHYQKNNKIIQYLTRKKNSKIIKKD